MNTYIYALIDPRDNQIRYVGKTNNPHERLIKHLKPSERKIITHKNNWVNRLLLQNLKPILDIIEECPEEIWQERERFWIKHYRDLGCDLTNTTDGGDGCSNPLEETRIKMSLAKKGKPLTDEHKKKLSESHKGKIISDVTKNKYSLSKIDVKIKNSSSKYFGVYRKSVDKWISQIWVGQSKFHLGTFINELDAAKAYDLFIFEKRLERKTNFPKLDISASSSDLS